jgi:hypothetical protein
MSKMLHVVFGKNGEQPEKGFDMETKKVLWEGKLGTKKYKIICDASTGFLKLFDKNDQAVVPGSINPELFLIALTEERKRG